MLLADLYKVYTVESLLEGFISMQGIYGEGLTRQLLDELQKPVLDREYIASACQLQNALCDMQLSHAREELAQVRLELAQVGMELAQVGMELADDRAQLHALTRAHMRANGYTGIRGLIGNWLTRLMSLSKIYCQTYCSRSSSLVQIC